MSGSDYYCHVCMRHCGTEEYLQRHLNGKPHAQVVASQKQPSPAKKAKTVDFNCFMCKTEHGTALAYNEHQRSTGHKEKIRQLLDQAEPKLDPNDSHPPCVTEKSEKPLQIVGVIKDSDGRPYVTLYARYHV